MTEDRFGSPLWLTDALQEHFGSFTVDLCAEPWSAVVPYFITEQMDVFRVKPEGQHGWMNPPYSKGSLQRFVGFARESVLKGRLKEVTLVVPHYTAEGWWEHVATPEGRVIRAEFNYRHIRHERLEAWSRHISEGLMIDTIPIARRVEFRPPPRYVGARESARFSSVVVRFSQTKGTLSSWLSDAALAGFFMGEGCIAIDRPGARDNRTFHAKAQMSLREDDRGMIDAFMKRFGGSVSRRVDKPTVKDYSPNRSPQLHWALGDREKLCELADVLERCPLPANKMRQVPLFREALTLLGAQKPKEREARMRKIHDEMSRLKRYGQ